CAGRRFSLRVTYGLLNLARREGGRPVVPGEPMGVEIALNPIAHRFPAGHRLRVAISTGYWPLAWPAPEPVTLSVSHGRIDLPVRPPRAEDARVALPPSETAQPGSLARSAIRKVEHDLVSGEVRTIVEHGYDQAGEVALTRIAATGLEMGFAGRRCFQIKQSDPLSAQAHIERRMVMRRTGWSTQVEISVRMSATREAFRLEAQLRAREGEREIVSRAWDETIPRDHL